MTTAIKTIGSREPVAHQLALGSRKTPVSLPGLSAGDAGDRGEGMKVRYLYDGECPLRKPEVELLQRLDAGKGRIEFVDISDFSYSPAENLGITYADAMGRPAAILADGTVLRSVEVYKKLYEAVGLGFVWAAAELPLVGDLVEWVFDKTVEYRLPLTGRPPLEAIVEQRRNSTSK